MSSLRKDADTALPQTPAAEVRSILDKLAARASCRDFDSSLIAPEILEDIVHDGVEAPSSCNQQNWHFIIVTDPARKKRAREISGGNHHFAECSALIYLCFQKGWTHGNFSIVQSVAGACYHMMLSAHLRGFQCIWNAGIGDHVALREMLDLPQTFDVIGALAIGRAKSTAPKMKAPRRSVEEIFSWERFERPEASLYPVKDAAVYPYWEIKNDSNPFAQWDPSAWSWAQIADFRGYSVWAKSPLAGVYVSRRQGDALEAEHALLPDAQSGARVAEIMPWGGTTTTALLEKLGSDVYLSVAELSKNNLSFIKERLRREGHDLGRVTFDLMHDGKLPYAGASIDLVVLPQVLEHMPDPKALLDEVGRVLAPGGSFVASTRNADSSYGALWRDQESKAQVPNQGPFTLLPAKDVAAWVAARFEIDEEVGIGAEATGDAAILTGAARYSGRIYAVRAHRV
ncbi:nitroreductase family protein [Pseudohalocynthiibacter sp. F2068]|uniref:nitroreductase family protein n=1 Tax=Pseudohalocynthiibacter sp. F2068 TaxID=2926418 RepID=UPI001FF41657|nr:nitroreductase family protein [Pseudohalocynthiibacter sp. F2068]